MPFRMNLQSLLRLRESLERQEEQRLAAANAVVAALRAGLHNLEELHLQQKEVVIDKMGDSCSAALLHFVSECDTAYFAQRAVLQKTLLEADEKRTRQMEIYKQAYQKREILRGLRDRLEREYELQRDRVAQQAADEVHLLHLLKDSAG